MHPYRPPQWQYGYALAPAAQTDPTNAYASYYSQMYGAMPVQAAMPPSQPPPPAPPQYPPSQKNSTTPAYSSDFSSGASGFSMPPPSQYQHQYQQRRNKYPSYQGQVNQNLQEVQLTKQPPPPPAQSRPHAESWQQIKQEVAGTSTATPAATPAVTAPVRPYYPMKRFVKSQENRTGDDDSDDSPICQRIYDLANHNKIKADYEKIDSEVSPGIFAVRLKLGGEVYTGTGQSFKLAKQAAANKALAATVYAKPVYKVTMKARPLGMTATQELFELATRKGANPEFLFLEPANFEFKPAMRLWTKDEMRAKYTVQLTLGEHKFIGEADLPQTAKHNAALMAIPVLNVMPDVKSISGTSAAGGDAGLLPNGKNVIMTLNEIAMVQGVCIEWTMVGENGPPHMRNYIWSMKMGNYESKGSGLSKKVAKTMAAQHMYETIPEEWKDLTKGPGGKRKKKRKISQTSDQPPVKLMSLTVQDPTKTTPGTSTAAAVPATSQPAPAVAAKTVPICHVVLTTNPISALFEYCKKAKLADPDFEVVSENVLESRPNDKFKKMEYTIKLTVNGKTFFGSGFTKKAAKMNVATEAWNIVRTGSM